jgi:hypothetical protein
MRSRLLFAVAVAALGLYGCGERWEGYVYPDKLNLTRHVHIGTYSSLSDCRAAAKSNLTTLNALTRGDYECALDCDGASSSPLPRICKRTER